MPFVQEIILSASSFAYPKMIQSVYGDTDRILRMSFSDYTIPGGATAVLNIHRPDATFYSIACTIGTNYAECAQDQILTRLGVVSCSLEFTASGKVLSSFPFFVEVIDNNKGADPSPQSGISIYEIYNDLVALMEKFPITSADLADGAATTNKIGAGAVTTPKLADAAVTNAKLATNAVDASKISDHSVTKQKLSLDYDDIQQVIAINSTTITLGDIASILGAVNTAGDHVFFDVSALGAQMYLCAIFIDTSANVYKIFDLVKGRVAEGIYNATTLLTMAIALASDIATQSQIDYLQGEIDELGGKSVVANWDVLGNMIQDGSSTNVISAGDIVPINWIATVLGTTTNGLTVTCSDIDAFAQGIGEAEAKTYLFVFDGASWTYEGASIALSDFGLSVSGNPATGEVMTIVTTVTSVDFTFTSYDTVSPVDNTVAHNWLLEQTYAPATKAYDTYESLFCILQGKTLAAGKYYLPMYSYRSGKTFNCCFTLAAALGSNDHKVQIKSNGYSGGTIKDATGADVSSAYYPSSLTPVVFGGTTTEGANFTLSFKSTADAVADGYALLENADPNDPLFVMGNFDCATLGDNTWPYSNIRTWLNDDSKNGDVVPTHDNDIASAYNRGAGFLYGIDPRVKALIQTANVTWLAGYGNVDDFTRNQNYTSNDRVFLLSMKEMGFATINTGEGAITDLYKEYCGGSATDSAVPARVKHNKAGGTLNNYRWSRSALSSSANGSRIITSTGSSNGSGAHDGRYFAPAFIIGKSGNP